MKQKITEEQLRELNIFEGRRRLDQWAFKNGYYNLIEVKDKPGDRYARIDHLNIGQLLHFLDIKSMKYNDKYNCWEVKRRGPGDTIVSSELIDALWEITKEVLDGQNI